MRRHAIVMHYLRCLLLTGFITGLVAGLATRGSPTSSQAK